MLLYAGQWDPNTSLLAHRMKELQGRRAYLKNFWYAAGVKTVVVLGLVVYMHICTLASHSSSLSAAPFIAARAY